MKKIMLLLVIFAFVVYGCTGAVKEPFCGDNSCDSNEKENGCAADCGGFEGITKQQCVAARGNWNECGSPCAGTGAEFCIQMCQQQCECGGIAGFGCPEGYECRLSGKIADEMGACVKIK